jgi:hypothetical protein
MNRQKLLGWLRAFICKELIEENKELKEKLERFTPRFQFTYWEEISGEELKKAILSAFPKVQTYLGRDEIYHILKWDELVEWLNKDSLEKVRWIKDIYDCDDFADQSKARMHFIVGRNQNINPAYGIAWGDTPMGFHAFNVALVIKDNQRKVVIIEPQNDDTREWKKSDYKPIIIII